MKSPERQSVFLFHDYTEYLEADACFGVLLVQLGNHIAYFELFVDLMASVWREDDWVGRGVGCTLACFIFQAREGMDLTDRRWLWEAAMTVRSVDCVV